MPIPEANRKYTYTDYLSWPEEERWEIIDGVPLLQSAPSWQHQALSRELILEFGTYLRDKPCQLFGTPFDLRLPLAGEKDEETIHVFQPDLTVICDKSKLKETGYFGTPNLVIEIVSASTGKIDKVSKFNAYEKAGVPEYWIAETEQKIVSVFKLQNGRYGRPETYTEEHRIVVGIFPDLVVELKRIFAVI